MTEIVEPGVQEVVEKSNRPCWKLILAGALPAGGLAGWPVKAIKRFTAKLQPVPPPVRVAVMFPPPTGDGAVNVLKLGVAVTTADATLVPTALVAVTEQLYDTPLVKPETTMGDAIPAPVKPPALQIAV